MSRVSPSGRILYICYQISHQRGFTGWNNPCPITATTAPTFREKILSTIFGRRPFQLAGGLAVLAFIALAITLWVFWKSSQNPQEVIVKVQPTPLITSTPVLAAPTPITSPEQTPAPSEGNTNTANTSTPPLVQPPANRAPEIKQPTLPQQPRVPAETVVALNDGGRSVTLDKQGSIEGLENLSPLEQQAVRTALQTGRAETPAALADLKGSDGTLMGNAPGGQEQSVAFDLQSPVGRVVRTDSPTFRWKALKGATAYRVDVFDSSFNKVLTSGNVSQTEWTALRPLPRGTLYSWQVTALVEGKEVRSPAPPQPEARFRVLDNAQSEGLKRAEKSYTGSPLALGLLYARAGLLDEAEREFRALLAEDPDSQVAQKLLRNLETLRGAK